MPKNPQHPELKIGPAGNFGCAVAIENPVFYDGAAVVIYSPRDTRRYAIGLLQLAEKREQAALEYEASRPKIIS